jgi:hypothetical protein
MKKATIKEQAEQFILDYGDAAYQKAQVAVRAARRHRNSRLGRYWAEVARAVARHTPVAIGHHARIGPARSSASFSS